MTKQDVTIGLKFTNGEFESGKVNTIVDITETRVIYNHGKKSSCGSSNRRQLNQWLTIDGFVKRVNNGQYVIL